MTYLATVQHGLSAFAADVVEGFLKITHNSMALIGLAVMLTAALLLARPDLRQQGEERLSAWLSARQAPALAAVVQTPSEPGAVERATAANPNDLPSEQAKVALWIARKYRVAPEPVAALVTEAYEVGRVNRIDPTLVLAVVAIESSFNPFAQSSVGAQGLMQVMTHIHSDKYEPFGGRYAAFDPKTNLRVGAKVLQEYIARTGSVEAGLRMYVGASNLPTDGGYVDKVMAEYARLSQVARSAQPAAEPQAAPVKLAALS